MHVDGARLDIDVVAPDRVQQLLAREHPARMLHQMAQQAEFGRAEMDGLAGPRHPVGGEIHRHLAELQRLLGGVRAGRGGSPRAAGRSARAG